jgi:hypothetical protein
MRLNICRVLSFSIALLMLIASGISRAQSGSEGTIAVTVQDASGGVVPQASLTLVQVDTNDRRAATSSPKGIFTFVNLPIGAYRLDTGKNGYATTTLDQIAVHAGQVTDVLATLKVGKRDETVMVDASSSSVLETTSNEIGMVIDLKYVEDLPLGGRDLSALVVLTPGYAGNPGYNEGATTQLGNFNGQVEMDTSSNIDGVIGSPSRGKYYGGNSAPAVTARIENIQEMSVQTDMMDVDKGFGQASMQVNFVSRSGTNKFHGRVFEDFKNDGLYANTWSNNANGLRRDKVIYNDFGASVGGPIIRDKLFFFGTFSERKIPGSYNLSNYVLTSAAQSGNFGYQYTNSSGATATNTVNLYSIASALGEGLPTQQNSEIASQLGLIDTAEGSGTVTATEGDPNISTLSWKQASPETLYYPMARLDYNISPKLRAGLSWNMTQDTKPEDYPQSFPGSGFSNQNSGYTVRNFTLAALLDWTVSPNLINQFRGGFLYNAAKYGYNAQPLYATEQTVAWPFPYPQNNMSGQSYTTPVTEYYPLFNGSDTVSWQHKNHTAKFGASWYREQDHYWNPPAGYATYALGLANGDPALEAFSTANFPNASSSQITEAENLYATLTGRISSVTGSNTYNQKTGSYTSAGTISAYNLDEVSNAWAWYAQDSWRVFPSLTLNYGMRWDYTGDNYDKTGAYHSAGPSGVYGPSGVGNLFNPGSLLGEADPSISVNPHAYKPWHRSPQPQVGFAWNPNVESGPFAKLFGGRSTVIRGGFGLKKFTEPYQFYWDAASDYGSFFYQYFYLYPASSASNGYFQAGSLALGDSIPVSSYGVAPTSYVKSEQESALAFQNFPMDGMDPNIQQPYVETWNFGIQRQLGTSRAIEIRYQGNHSVHQWVAVNPNEVNIFENGFLTEFQHAQANYKINQAAGIQSFANNGYSGQYALPIMTQAFQGETSGGSGVGLADFGNSQFLNYLSYGEAGAMASVLSGYSGTVPYICNLVGANFSPCSNILGYTGSGTYPINFFQANPYASGNGGTGYLEAIGYSNYNSLQAEFRQQNWRGLQWNANYAWSHTLGFSSQENWTGGASNYGSSVFTLRNSQMHRNYTPGEYDIRQVLHVNGTYDLPFGKGKPWLSSNSILSAVVGNWTMGNIITWQTGMPQQLTGGYQTYNDFADGGITLGNGLTASKLQKAVHVHRLPQSVANANWANGTPNYVVMLDSKYLSSSTSGGANSTYITPNTTAGSLGDTIFLHGPHGFYHDMALSKVFPIHERLKLSFQGEFLNVWNHPVFGNGNGFMNGSTQSSNFGLATGGPNNLPRHIQLRANIEF